MIPGLRSRPGARLRPCPPWLALSLVLAAGTGLAALSPARALEGGSPGGARLRLLASGGLLFFWDGASTNLRPAPAGLASAPQGFRSVLPLDDARALLIEPAELPPGKQKEKKVREGQAVVLGLSETGAERGGPVVSFEGSPNAAAVSPDGRRAYVLAWRGEPGAGGRGWLHAIDVDRGEVADSSLLSTHAFGIATDKAGGRLYLSLKDRIQTYGAEPVRVSWQYRSPGLNGPIAVAPEADLLAVGRGAEVALFDAARLAATATEERHARRDDATMVTTLPFVVTRLAWSEDGSLLAAIGVHGLVFIDPGNGALLWPPAPSIDFSGATDALVLKFPASDHDVVLALAPGGAVSALRAPVPSAPVVPATARLEEPPAPMAVAAATAQETPRKAPQDSPPPPAPQQPEPAPQQAEPPKDDPAPDPKQAEPAPKPAEPPAAEAGAAPTTEPAPEQEQASGPPRLRGRISGKGVRSIVLYGPNNILKEALRVEIQPDGTWNLELPAPGTYRVVAIGDGSTPIPVVPTFRTVTVRAGIGESGLDFEVRPAS